MVRLRDQLSGNILLYEYLATKRHALFLRRNLAHARQIEQHLEAHGTIETFPWQSHDFRSKWKPPSCEQVHDMMPDEILHQSFELLIHNIEALDGMPSRSAVVSTLTRKSRMLTSVRAVINMTISEKGSDSLWTNPPREVILHFQERNHKKRVGIDMSPIVATGGDYVSALQGVAAKESYRMHLSLDLLMNDDAVVLYDYLGLDDTNGVTKRMSTSCQIMTEHLMEREKLLLVDQSGKGVCYLEISMRWSNDAHESVLTRANRCNKRTSISRSPDLKNSYDTESQTHYQITYDFGVERTTKLGLVCPLFCVGDPIANVYELEDHLARIHDNMIFRPVHEFQDAQGVEHWRIHVEAASQRGGNKRASSKADDPRDVSYISQSSLSNTRSLEEMREGTSNTATMARVQTWKCPLEIQNRLIGKKRKYTMPQPPPGTTFFRQLTKRVIQPGENISESEDEMDSAPLRLRKNAEIESLAVSASAKKFLRLYDEYMRRENVQSDIHAAEATVRFARIECAEIRRYNVIDEFEKKLQEMLEDDLLSKDMQAACLETVHSSQLNSQQPNTQLQRLEGLTSQRAEMTRSFVDSNPSSQSSPKWDGKGKGKTQFGGTEHSTTMSTHPDVDHKMYDAGAERTGTEHMPKPKPHPPSTRLPYDECFCGEDALSSLATSPAIACNDIDCIRRHFHFDCARHRATQLLASIDPNDQDWICSDCASASGSSTSRAV